MDVELGGRRHALDVRRHGDRWRVVVDGREVPASVSQIGTRWSVLIGQRSYEVSIEARGNGGYVVHVNGHAVSLTFVDAFRGRRDTGGSTSSGPKPVVAPMPGRVVRVLVKPGDAVTARQGLVVVEAMKMENELRAPRDGIVTAVRVSEGASVEANTVLVVIE
jgi:biotin carboxyl carrier protein